MLTVELDIRESGREQTICASSVGFRVVVRDDLQLKSASLRKTMQSKFICTKPRMR